MTPTSEAGSRPQWGISHAVGLVVGAHLVLLIGGGLVIGIGGWSDPYPITAQVSALIPFWIFSLVGSVLLTQRLGGGPVHDLGLELRPLDVPLGIVVGLGMQFAVLPVIYWPLLRLFGSDVDALEKASRELADSAPGTVGTILFVVMACLMAPVVEEVLYRGVLMRALGRVSPAWGVVGSSLVFGALHFQPLQFIGLALFGVSAALLAQRSGRLGPAVVAHVAFNAGTVVKLLIDR